MNKVQILWRAATSATISLGLLTGLLTSTALAQTYAIQSTFGTIGSGNGQFRAPTGMAIDPTTGHIVVADQLNNNVQIFDSTGVYLSQFGSTGSGNGQFKVPQGVAIDPTTHNIVVADFHNNRVQIFDSTGVYLSQFGSTGTGNGQFTAPDGVAIDPTTHNIVVIDNTRVEIFTSTGGYLSQFGSPGTGNGQFLVPIGIAIDPTTHDILVVDNTTNRVQIFDSTGAYLSQFGSPGSGNGQLNQPVFVAIDPTSHNIVVSDAFNNRVEIFNSAGVYLSQFGLIGEPEGVAIDPATLNIVVVDYTQDRVEIFAANTAVAVEYYYSVWNFYFETAFPAEIAALDGGAFGGAWQRTGQTFNVWPQPNAMSSPTCRFFTTAFAPKSSHFYTPFPSECAIVRTEPAWLFEAIAFYIQLADLNGLCSGGTIPLYRLYNNGMGGAPNHRYTTSLTILNQMVAAGWVFEGNGNTKVFACVPQ